MRVAIIIAFLFSLGLTIICGIILAKLDQLNKGMSNNVAGVSPCATALATAACNNFTQDDMNTARLAAQVGMGLGCVLTGAIIIYFFILKREYLQSGYQRLRGQGGMAFGDMGCGCE